MNICIPIAQDKGLQSPVSAHFGSAPFFMIVETDSWCCRVVPNRNLDHEHGACQPLASLQSERLDGMVVGGIVIGALSKLLAAGLRVFRSDYPTVESTMKAFKSGALRPMTADAACTHHGRGHQ